MKIPFAVGILVSVSFAIVIALTHFQGLWMAKSEVEREVELMAVYLVLRDEQRHFSGERMDNGCYILQDRTIQDAVTRYSLTSDELGQNVDELLCNGWIRPANLSSK